MERVRISFRELFQGVEGVLLAVSGGVDSMALLGASTSWPGAQVASLDHGLRREASAEVELVRTQAQALGLPFHTARLEVDSTVGVEAGARASRYAALSTIARREGLRFIATAHTATDQAETVLMRLTRGSAMSGAAGILRRRGDGVVRPLLFAARADTERFVRTVGLPFVHDPMNDVPAHLRVRVRSQVLPALEAAVGPHAVAGLARFAELAAEDDAWLEAEATLALARCRVPRGLDWLAVTALGVPIRRRVLARWLAGHGVPLDARLLHDALVAIGEKRTVTLSGDRLLHINQGSLTISTAPARLHGTSSSEHGRGQGD
ncbi:MAG: tRNA lysidine(34) synthetase TilS [Myxococcaceae bacterium]|nr:tRNA lysidine(34) synthetase TilS [Myxococcaceae bacterium]